MQLNRINLLALSLCLAGIVGCQSRSQSVRDTKADSSHAAPAAIVSSPAPAASAPDSVPRQVIRIKAGTSAIKDAAGIEWLEDAGFEGGDVIERPELEIANTRQPEIYRSEHYAMDSFRCKLPNGRYQVKLHFCETFEGIYGPGERVFSFDVEGKPFNDFDVWAKAGGFARAYVETVDVNVADGQLDIKFTANIENPQINAVEISALE